MSISETLWKMAEAEASAFGVINNPRYVALVAGAEAFDRYVAEEKTKESKTDPLVVYGVKWVEISSSMNEPRACGWKLFSTFEAAKKDISRGGFVSNLHDIKPVQPTFIQEILASEIESLDLSLYRRITEKGEEAFAPSHWNPKFEGQRHCV